MIDTIWGVQIPRACLTRFSAVLLFTCVELIAVTSPASALSVEQARATCQQTVKAPAVRACMQASGGGRAPDREGRLAKCRAAIQPQMSACVQAALNKANGRANVAIALESGSKKEVIDLSLALPAGFVPPPRTINDITAVLDQAKPDAKRAAEMLAQADSPPPAGGSTQNLLQFHYDRASARLILGRTGEALADAQKALQFAQGDVRSSNRSRQLIAVVKQAIGDQKGALQSFQEINRAANAGHLNGWIIGSSFNLISTLITVGDVAQAEGYLRQLTVAITEGRTSGKPGLRQTYAAAGRMWESDYEGSRGIIFEAKGQYRDAESFYMKAADYKRASIADLPKYIALFGNDPSNSSDDAQRHSVDQYLIHVARMKAKQGRLAEAEADIRQVLLSRLKTDGKFSPRTPKFIVALANVLVDEGRYAGAEKLFRAVIDIQRSLGIADESLTTANALNQLGAVLVFQRRAKDAASVYAEMEHATSNWDAGRRQLLAQNGSRITALYESGQVTTGLSAAQSLVDRRTAQLGERHFDTADARGTLAIGYVYAGRNADAIKEFDAAIPVLMTASRENADDGDDTVSAARSQRLQAVVETYIRLLANTSSNADGNAALESFRLADAIRGRTVQKALSASSARSIAKDPALAELVRNEQDLGKQINARLGALNNALGSDVRDDDIVKATKANIDKLRGDQTRIRADITKRFPSYADLIDPQPPTIDQTREALTDGEATVSFYFGRDTSFVWAVPKVGAVAFAEIKATSGEIESKVRSLREALEPQAAMISDIPPYDLKLGHELYLLLLQPVEAGWKSSKSLIVVTNGALGLLPLSLLPTAPATIDPSDEPLFSGYRNVPWLARTHAVTMVPSSAALRTLRQLPPGKPGRGELIAFGDPLFSAEQAAEAEKSDVQIKLADTDAATTRGIPLKRRSSPKLEEVDSAELAMLPRLPDTADELKSIALALQADPSKILNLGKAANEQAVKTMTLSGFKVVAFATHGLVPGELNGLTQPALALSSPAVTGGDGDGLLTMEEILGLKLDADWVVLSACNTGAGTGAGAEAASGLGRAFFYAGTRALLVTNWSVHSQSARELVTDLFKRQADDPKLTRGEALRQAMMALADGPGYIGADGKTEFSYAHPLFWAPYSIIGDGGAR
jgi:CHAT domain-containing protein